VGLAVRSAAQCPAASGESEGGMSRLVVKWLHLRVVNTVSDQYRMFAWFDDDARLVATFAVGVN
jgi:hypothetical protein